MRVILTRISILLLELSFVCQSAITLLMSALRQMLALSTYPFVIGQSELNAGRSKNELVCEVGNVSSFVKRASLYIYQK